MYLTTLGLIFGCSGSSLLLGLFSLFAVSSGYSVVVVLWLLIVMASLAEHSSRVHGRQQLWLLGSRAQAPSLWHMGLIALSMWDLLRSGIEPVFPALAGRFFTTKPQGKPS